MGIGKSTFHAQINAGLFVPPVKLGPRASGWPDYEVDVLVAARIAGRSDAEIRQLVTQLMAARQSSYAAQQQQANETEEV
jgi:prophage regulatory protein